MLKWKRKPRLFLSVDNQSGNGIQLKANVRPNRADRRLIAKTRDRRRTAVVQVEIPSARPDIAAVEEDHRAKVPPEVGAKFG